MGNDEQKQICAHEWEDRSRRHVPALPFTRMCRICCEVQTWRQTVFPDPFTPEGVDMGEWKIAKLGIHEEVDASIH